VETRMSERPRSERWTREEWERLLEEERRSATSGCMIS
jgi:hypothetical protein